MKKIRIREIFAISVGLLRLILIIPLVPMAIGIVLFFAWCIEQISKIPEDLDEQVRLANKSDV